MSDGVRVRIVTNPRTEGIDLFFLERVNGKTVCQLNPVSGGGWERVPVEGGQIPSLTFGEEIGRDVLQSLAEQLAQLGYVRLNDAPQIGAMKAHLDDMREQAHRLYSLLGTKL